MLLADADVLIDYRESDLTILGLVARHVGRMAVLESILDEVLASSQRTCRREARRNTIGDDQTSRIRILSAPFDHSSGGPR